MMQKKSLFFVVIFFSVCIQTTFVHAVKVIRKEKEFYKRVERAPFVVVMFYTHDKHGEVMSKNIDRQKRYFGLVSRSEFYRNGDVDFLEVDLSRHSLDQLAREFNISKTPTFMLFRRAKPVVGPNKKPVVLTGFVKDDALKKFINTHLRTALHNYIESRAQIKAQEREARERSASNFSFYVGYPAIYPYYYNPWTGYPYYTWGPGVSFNATIGY